MPRLAGPLAHGLLTACGLWLMIAPGSLDYGGTTGATVHRVTGPVLAAAAFLAVFVITRGMRWLELPVGACLVLSPLLGLGAAAAASSLVVGVLALALAWVGEVDENPYGGGWGTLWHTARLPRDSDDGAGPRL